jgi:hypothetical protein
MSAAPAPRVDPDAALELVEAIGEPLRLLITESSPVLPNLAYQLAAACEQTVNDSAVDAAQVARVRWFAWAGRRLDLAAAFSQLNPEFGEVHHGCYQGHHYGGADDRLRQAATQRHELALALGDRAADLLDPPADQGAGVAGR